RSSIGSRTGDMLSDLAYRWVAKLLGIHPAGTNPPRGADVLTVRDTHFIDQVHCHADGMRNDLYPRPQLRQIVTIPNNGSMVLRQGRDTCIEMTEHATVTGRP